MWLQRGLFLSEVNNRENKSDYLGEEWNILSKKTNRKVPTVGEWTHVVAVFDVNIGHTWYINSVNDSFIDINNAIPQTDRQMGCPPVYLCAKAHGGSFHVDGALDDIKYWYRTLTAEGESFFCY